MAARTGNVVIFDNSQVPVPGADKWTVASGTTASISAGQIVLRDLGGVTVRRMSVSNVLNPSVSSPSVVGVSNSASNETASLAGNVDVVPNVYGMTYLIAPNDSTAWDTQAEYDALVGKRVLITVTSGGVQTLLASDSANNGCIVMPLNIATTPNRVRIAIRAACNTLQ